MPEAPAQTSPTTPRRRRRWRRYAVLLPILLIALVLVLLQTPAAGWIVRPILAAQTGMDVRTGLVTISPNGQVTIRDARFYAPGIPGQPGEVLAVERISARIDWGGMLGGSPGLNSVRLDSPMLRLSQDTETGVLNAAAFALAGGGGAGKTPSVEITRGSFEVGEHRGAVYTPLKRWSVHGSVTPAPGDAPASFSFTAVPTTPVMASSQAAPGASLGIEGTIGDAGVEGRLNGLTLEDWPASIVPSRVRPFYERLALRGSLLPTRFGVDPDGRVTVAMTLDGVELNLPIDPDQLDARRLDPGQRADTPSTPLRMRGTRGTVVFGTEGVTCDLSGLIDELVYDVALSYRGLDPDAPFDAELATSFRLSDSFRPSRFLPAKAIEKIDMFSSPSADIRATVRLNRPSPSAPVRLEGTAELSNGSARYRGLPYPFDNIRGTVRFTEREVLIENIRGEGPTGAQLFADGSFDGLDEASSVELRVRIESVPIDSVMLNALSPGRQELVRALFSETQHAQLVDDGLVRAPGTIGDPSVPAFAFGGLARIDLTMRRHPERPSGDRWSKEAIVTIDEAGMVPERFPLPIVARGVQIRIADQEIALTGGRYQGLTGGSATVTAEIDPASARPGRDPLPLIEIQADGIPVDARLLAAIPGYRDGPIPSPADGIDDVTLRGILDQLRVRGTVECNALIGPRPDGSIGYDIEANLFDASARPAPLLSSSGLPAGDLVLEGLDGTVYVRENLIVVDLGGLLTAPETPFVPTPISLLTQLTLPDRRGGLGGVERVGGLLPIQSGPPLPGPTLFADARADGLDLAMPIEQAVAVVSPGLAQRLRLLRDERSPDGIVAVRARLEGIVGGHTETTLGIDRIEALSFDDGGQRHRIGPTRGRAHLTLGVHPRVAFELFRTPVVSGGQPAGEISLDGALPLIRGGSGELRIRAGDRLTTSVRGARVESPLTRRVANEAVGGQVGDWLEARAVVGGFDLDVVLEPIAGGRSPEEGYGLPAFSVFGTLEPTSLAMEMPDGRVDFPDLGGGISFDGLSGRIDRVSAAGQGVAISADGDWSFAPGRGASLDVVLSVYGERFGQAFRALTPSVVTETMELFQVETGGAIRLDELRITGERLGTPERTLQASGRVGLSSASAVIGLPITQLDGEVGFRVGLDERGTSLVMDLHADRLRAGALRVESAYASIVSDPSRPGAVLVPEVNGRLHGGRVAGSAQSHLTDRGRQYWVDMHGSDVRAAPVFDDLLLPPGGLEGPPLPGQEAVRSAWSVTDDYTRGLLDADVSLTGTVGDPSSTRGRGVVRVAGGSVIALPGLINLIEFSNLNAPVGATLALAEAAFYIDGTTLAFERLSAASRTVEILGFGTLDTQTREIDMRFRSRSVRPVPILSGLFESLRDELITTRISGKPGEIRYAASTFSGTRRLVGALMGDEVSDQDRVMDAVERASRQRNNPTSARADQALMPGDAATDDWPASTGGR